VGELIWGVLALVLTLALALLMGGTINGMHLAVSEEGVILTPVPVLALVPPIGDT